MHMEVSNGVIRIRVEGEHEIFRIKFLEPFRQLHEAGFKLRQQAAAFRLGLLFAGKLVVLVVKHSPHTIDQSFSPVAVPKLDEMTLHLLEQRGLVSCCVGIYDVEDPLSRNDKGVAECLTFRGNTARFELGAEPFWVLPPIV